MNRLRSGELDVVCNHDIISEGFDAPGVGCVIVGAPTASIVRYLQRAGRAMRPGQDKTALILDLAGIAHCFGPADEPREWTLADGAIRPTAGVLPIAPEDIRKDRKPLGMVECELREVGEWGDDSSAMVDSVEVAKRVGVSGSALSQRIGRPWFPQPVMKHPTTNRNLWRESDISDHLGSLTELVTTEEAAGMFGIVKRSFVSKRHTGTLRLEPVIPGGGGGGGRPAMYDRAEVEREVKRLSPRMRLRTSEG